MKRRALCVQINLHDLLRVIPGTAGIGHEDGSVQTNNRDGDEVPNEEEGFDKGKGQCREKDTEEHVHHPVVRIRCRLDDPAGILDRRLRYSVQLDASLYELDSAVCPSRHRLDRGAGEPIDHGATDHEAQDKRSDVTASCKTRRSYSIHQQTIY